MSDAKPKKKGGLIKTLVVYGGGALAMAGAGAAGGVYAAQSGLIGGEAAKSGHGAPKGHSKPSAHGESEEGGAPTYYAFQQSFTSNLRDSGSFVQLSLAVATVGDEKIAEEVKTNEAALRSIVLMTVADEDVEALATTKGKQALQAKLRDVMNAQMKAKTGSAPIDSVYFTSFVIQ